VIDVAGVDQLTDELALFGRAGKRRQKRELLLAILGPGVVLEGASQRQVLWLGLLGYLVDIGCDEGKGLLGVAFVFGEVEADPADHVPNGAMRAQVPLDTVLEMLGLSCECHTHVCPDVCEERGIEKLGALHGRRRLDQGCDFVGIWIWNDEGFRICRIERATHMADEHPTDVAPV